MVASIGMLPPTPKPLDRAQQTGRPKSADGQTRRTRDDGGRQATDIMDAMKQSPLKFDGPAKMSPKMDEMRQVRLKHHRRPMMSTDRPLYQKEKRERSRTGVSEGSTSELADRVGQRSPEERANGESGSEGDIDVSNLVVWDVLSETDAIRTGSRSALDRGVTETEDGGEGTYELSLKSSGDQPKRLGPAQICRSEKDTKLSVGSLCVSMSPADLSLLTEEVAKSEGSTTKPRRTERIRSAPAEEDSEHRADGWDSPAEEEDAPLRKTKESAMMSMTSRCKGESGARDETCRPGTGQAQVVIR